MKKFIIRATLIISFLAGAAYPQTEPRFGIGVAATGQLPVGDLADATGLGYGGFGILEMGAYPGLALTARSGYVQFLEKENNTLSYIPIMAGLKASGVEGALYMIGEVGAVMTKVDYSGTPLLGQDVDETNLGWSVGVGSMAGALDFRLSLNIWNAAKVSESLTVGLSLGVNAYSW